jgi:chromosome segregation ATPase
LHYNPFTPKLRALQNSIERTQSRRRGLLEQIEWYGRFDPDEADSRLLKGQRSVQGTRKRVRAMQQQLSALASAIEKISEVARLGFHPRYWFSSERAAAKQQLATLKAEATQLSKEKGYLESEIGEREQAFKLIKSDIERHRTFDVYLANATVRALDIEIGEMELRLAKISTRNDELDALLHEPNLRLSELERQRDRLKVEIDQALRLVEELNAASTRYERAKIHERCQMTFGDGKPSRVVSDRRAKLNSALADIQKLTARLDQIVLRAEREIRTLIIDGNNLCYQQDRFIGLTALQGLVPKLSKRYGSQ